MIKQFSNLSDRLFLLISFVVLCSSGTADSEIKLSLKSQFITMNSAVDNIGANLLLGPFLKNNEKYDLYFQAYVEEFIEIDLFEKYTNRLLEATSFDFLDVLLLRTSGKRLEVGPLFTVMGVFGDIQEYDDHKDGSSIGLAAGIGVHGRIKFKRDKMLSARVSAAFTVASACSFEEDKDSAEWIDTTYYDKHDSSSFSREYHYSAEYLQRLKDVAREYESNQFPFYWSISYTKHAEWIFLGAGVNGFLTIESKKHKRDISVKSEYSTFIHFGVRFGRKSANNGSIKMGDNNEK